MVHKNYIVLAHDRPEQLNRLINRLEDEYSHFYIHIDKKVNQALFVKLLLRPSVTFIEDRVGCKWGDFSIVQATINCARKIIKDQSKRYTILLSGQCYPIADNNSINTYLQQNSEFDHIDIEPIDKLWPDYYQERIHWYSMNVNHHRKSFLILPELLHTTKRQILISILVKVFTTAYAKKTVQPIFMLCKAFKKRQCTVQNHFGGSQWWAVKYDTLKEMMNFIDSNKKYCEFHRYTYAPDEMFFHTIIMYLAERREMKIKRSLTYVNWFRQGCPLPVLFNEDDFDEIITQRQKGKLFARKFDFNFSGSILDLIEGYTG